MMRSLRQATTSVSAVLTSDRIMKMTKQFDELNETFDVAETSYPQNQ